MIGESLHCPMLLVGLTFMPFDHGIHDIELFSIPWGSGVVAVVDVFLRGVRPCIVVNRVC